MSSSHSLKIRTAQIALAALHPVLQLEHPAPLKIGVREELAARYPDIPRRTLFGLMSWLTARPAYLKACTPGAQRVGLLGEIEGVVTAEQARHAADRLAAILAKQKA